MLPVAYLYCESCQERRLFSSREEAPPIDPNLAMCDVCGFSFGYKTIDEVIDGRIEHVSRPRISAEVMAAGISEYRAEYIEQLKSRGGSLERIKADRRLENALASDDLEARRRLTHPNRSGITPDLAGRILDPRRSTDE